MAILLSITAFDNLYFAFVILGAGVLCWVWALVSALRYLNGNENEKTKASFLSGFLAVIALIVAYMGLMMGSYENAGQMRLIFFGIAAALALPLGLVLLARQKHR